VIGDFDLSNSGFNWEGKLLFNYKFGNGSAVLKNTSLQLTAEYESKEIIPQGRNKEQFESDFALRREFLKKRAAAITFTIDDIFNSDRWGQIYDTENFYQDAYRRWGVRSYRVTLSYRFGKNDFKFGGQRENRNGGGDDD
jgi:hypothetical protein